VHRHILYLKHSQLPLVRPSAVLVLKLELTAIIYATSNRRVTVKINWEGCGSKMLWFILMHSFNIFLQDISSRSFRTLLVECAVSSAAMILET